ncbi:MAG: hypothetical protein ACTHU0_21920 [Kofleriaceae bacterium]
MLDCTEMVVAPANTNVADAQADRARNAEEQRMAKVAEEPWKGSKCDPKRKNSETAKLIRQELRAATKDPKHALFGCAISVRARYATHSAAIDVRITSVPDRGMPILNPRFIEAYLRNPHRFSGLKRYSERGQRILDAATAIVTPYNYDRSDSQTDYHDRCFFQDVDFAFDLTEAVWKEIESDIRKSGLA